MKKEPENNVGIFDSILNFMFPHSKLTVSVDRFDKELTMNFAELVTSKGYPLETYEVITEDGYKLTLYRIYDKEKKEDRRNTVYFQHGLFVSLIIIQLILNNIN